MIEQFLWVIFPYIALTIFIGGHIYRYNHDQFGWTAKSSELLEKKQLKWGSNLFHFGIIFVFFGHVLGILIPASIYEALGVTKDMYHILAIAGGIPAGIIATVGLLILINRRLTDKHVKLTSSKGDFVALFFLSVVMLTGLASTFLNINPQGFDYRTTIGPWFRSLFVFQPDPTLMSTVPIWFKIHILAAFAFFAVWPFTRMVHVFSFPLKYLSRSFVVYRKRRPYKQDQPVKKTL
ncbi:nitrate reductase gamma subunit [Caldalkalibacillus uzonensis]|uniref:Nitrate reductase gamma subunit n=1 Tax=Caldalkalibacillus uzonensis TaxID=353224 RepID=A0ABU0CRN6_9BACI|nr:respiratory nitrate reductase subunit gamma [Caldalkalibacillus uzonensis]MDQ0339086.1 nitrate reductase gamma subunit [Caldalkalibacillus uzonensis]